MGKCRRSNNGDIWYLNRRSVEKQRDYVTGWVRIDIGDTSKSKPEMVDMALVYGREPSYLMSLEGAIKGSSQIRTFQTIFYDRNGNPIYSESGSGEWQYCTPGTMDEFAWEALMKAAWIRY